PASNSRIRRHERNGKSACGRYHRRCERHRVTQTSEIAAEEFTINGDTNVDTPIRRKIGAREYVSTFGTNIAIQLCTIMQGILLARLLGPTGRGQFAAATLWPTIFAGVGGLGLTVALARRSARMQDPSRIV